MFRFGFRKKCYSNSELLDIYQSIVAKVREKCPHFILKIIISDMRSKTVKEQYRLLDRAFKLRKSYPNLVVGYDLIGYETNGHPLFYYLDNLLCSHKFFQQKYQVDLPFFFHAGESGWACDKSIYDAVLLKRSELVMPLIFFIFLLLLNKLKNRTFVLRFVPSAINL